MSEHAAPMLLARRTEVALETALFRARWLLVPFYAGLIVAMVLLLAKFVKAIVASVDPILKGSSGEAMIAILSLVDAAPVANPLKYFFNVGTARPQDMA